MNIAEKSTSLFLRVCAILFKSLLGMIGAPLSGTVEILTLVNGEILKPLSDQVHRLKTELENHQPTNPLPHPIAVDRSSCHLGARETA